jgi:hypothetical protein
VPSQQLEARNEREKVVMARKSSKKIQPSFSTAQRKQHNVLLFAADGELILTPIVRIPIELKTLSYDGALPVLVELTARSSFAELGLRRGFKKMPWN